MKDLFEQLSMFFFPRDMLRVGSMCWYIFLAKSFWSEMNWKFFPNGCTNAPKATWQLLTMTSSLMSFGLIQYPSSETSYLIGPEADQVHIYLFDNGDIPFFCLLLFFVKKRSLYPSKSKAWVTSSSLPVAPSNFTHVWLHDHTSISVTLCQYIKALSMSTSSRKLDMLKAMFVAVLGVYKNQLSEYIQILSGPLLLKVIKLRQSMLK